MATALLSNTEAGACALELPTAPVAHGIVSQALLTAPGLRATLFRFAPGQELSEHTSTARVLVQVIEGRAEFTLGGETRTVVPGELLHMPPRLPHAVRAIEQMTLLVIQAAVPTS